MEIRDFARHVFPFLSKQRNLCCLNYYISLTTNNMVPIWVDKFHINDQICSACWLAFLPPRKYVLRRRNFRSTSFSAWRFGVDSNIGMWFWQVLLKLYTKQLCYFCYAIDVTVRLTLRRHRSASLCITSSEYIPPRLIY